MGADFGEAEPETAIADARDEKSGEEFLSAEEAGHRDSDTEVAMSDSDDEKRAEESAQALLGDFNTSKEFEARLEEEGHRDEEEEADMVEMTSILPDWMQPRSRQWAKPVSEEMRRMQETKRRGLEEEVRYRTVRTHEKNTEVECLAQGMRIAACRLSATGQWGLPLEQVTAGHVEPVEFLKGTTSDLFKSPYSRRRVKEEMLCGRGTGDFLAGSQ